VAIQVFTHKNFKRLVACFGVSARVPFSQQQDKVSNKCLHYHGLVDMDVMFAGNAGSIYLPIEKIATISES